MRQVPVAVEGPGSQLQLLGYPNLAVGEVHPVVMKGQDTVAVMEEQLLLAAMVRAPTRAKALGQIMLAHSKAPIYTTTAQQVAVGAPVQALVHYIIARIAAVC